MSFSGNDYTDDGDLPRSPVFTRTGTSQSGVAGTYRVDTFLTVVELPAGVTFTSASGNPYAVAVSSVPEPESYALFVAGLGAMGMVMRRRRR
jgi:hypothetical protein